MAKKTSKPVVPVGGWTSMKAALVGPSEGAFLGWSYPHELRDAVDAYNEAHNDPGEPRPPFSEFLLSRLEAEARAALLSAGFDSDDFDGPPWTAEIADDTRHGVSACSAAEVIRAAEAFRAHAEVGDTERAFLETVFLTAAAIRMQIDAFAHEGLSRVSGRTTGKETQRAKTNPIREHYRRLRQAGNSHTAARLKVIDHLLSEEVRTMQSTCDADRVRARRRVTRKVDRALEEQRQG